MDKSLSVVLFFLIGLILIIYPLPGVIMDLLFALNLSLSFVILLLAVYVDNPVKFSSFPSMLLFMVYFHLALIVASVRLILFGESPGVLSQVFGRLMLAGTGNFVIGLVVFVVILVIQYLVITNGQQRIAEVAARFTLDAMPGKQMSIDADVSAGFITPEEARERRKELEREAAFFGAMDGASRFVKGEVIAAALAALVSSVGGVLIGMTRGMTAAAAFQYYFTASVGFVMQITISSLLISMAAGLLVTRVSREVGLATLVVDELVSYPKVLQYAAYMFWAFALLPGIGSLTTRFVFVLFGAGLFILARRLGVEVRAMQPEVAGAGEAGAEASPSPAEELAELGKMEHMLALVGVDPFELEFGYGLLPLFDIEQGGDLLSRISLLRRNITQEMGFPVPPVRVHDSYMLGANEYLIKVKGVKEGSGVVYTDRFLAMGTPEDLADLPGVEVKEPVFGLPAKWIPSSVKLEAEARGVTVVDAGTVILTHLGEIIRANLHEVITRQQVKEVLDHLSERYPAVVEDVLNTVGLGDLEAIIRRLLKEKVPLKDIVTILEAAADAYKTNQQMPFIIDYIREKVRKHIIQSLTADDGKLHVLIVDPALEKAIEPALEGGALPPGTALKVVNAVKSAVNRQIESGFPPVLVVSSKNRYKMFDFVYNYVSKSAVVVSYNEIRDSDFVQDGVVRLP